MDTDSIPLKIMNRKPKAPCRNCADRNISCHSSCEKYVDFRKQLDDFNIKLKKQKEDYRERHNSVRRFHI